MEKRNNSTFVRVLIFLYIAVLLFLVFNSFYRNAIPFEFSPGLITVLFIITLLILSEAFDNLSIGKLFSLSREVKQKEEEVEKAKEENKELRENIISLASVVTQNQSNNTYFGLPQEFLKKAETNVDKDKDKDEELIDEKAEGSEIVTPTDKEEGSEEVTPTDEDKPASGVNEPKATPISQSRIMGYLHDEGLNRFIESQKIPFIDVVREVEFSSDFKDIDPIGDQRIVFDAYYKTPSKEYFIEGIFSRSIRTNPMRRFQIYTMIAKVFFYQQLKKTPAELILVFINVPESFDSHRMYRNFNVLDIFKQFQPAVAKGILRIETIDLSEDDIKNIQDKYTDNNHNK